MITREFRLYCSWFYRTKRYTCSFTPLYGGNGGGYFDDGCEQAVRKIDLYYQGHTIRAIRLRYRRQSGTEYDGAWHGQTFGTHFGVNLSLGEEIVAVVGRYTSSRVQQLAFLTQHPYNPYIRHTFGPYGNPTGTLFIENRGNIVAIYGRQGADLDALGFKYLVWILVTIIRHAEPKIVFYSVHMYL